MNNYRVTYQVTVTRTRDVLAESITDARNRFMNNEVPDYDQVSSGSPFNVNIQEHEISLTPSLFDSPMPFASRRTDPTTSRLGEASLRFRRGTHHHKIMQAFTASQSLSNGLNSWEAGKLSGLAEIPSCGYWKRVSELAQLGALEPTGKTRPGASGEAQTVYRATGLGLAYLKTLADSETNAR